ncbi:N-acetylmuramoyl-L-alanine amidase family protein [Flavobacterium microcysteis]|uniref:N-acetylmuramoyl-L-alanine amidase n=1 Tax=Flavobacterium microcysteis TaxID=2596891 RepID=A0A501QEQ6_9FLAO|nr:N-acetylmuramoyl-L-alanine amidase [Flavobacterium microcysteis]TPD70607.1 N-acetylmuramoyl-L-alanine amidase [Flavobacterium microcysteis]
MYIHKKFKYSFAILACIVSFAAFGQSGDKFKVVLDAGHGSKDFGAVKNSFVEKNIALAVALKVGRLVDKQPNVDVVYTRSTDVFIELVERANIANRANADLFVSIHCNSNPNSEAFGTETYVMGLTKVKSNLEVAKNENQVITLEADYKVKYAGYDPKSPESLIGITLIQEEHLDQSIAVASKIQDNFTQQLNRKSRGVKQAPFMVLHKTSMPSVLIEMGFLSNKTEGNYLNSEEGQNEIAKAIADAIMSYKKEYYGGTSIENKIDKDALKVEMPREAVSTAKKDSAKAPVTKAPEPKKPEVKTAETKAETKNETKTDSKGVVFKVQISASGTKLDLVPSNFKGLNTISMISEGNLYKYMYGETSDYEKAKELVQEAKSKGFTTSYLIAFKNGKKISIQEALK